MTASSKIAAEVAAERALIGAVLAQPKRMAAIGSMLKAEDFSVPAHAALFAAVVELDSAGHAVDPITVAGALSARGQLDQVGGMGGIVAFDTEAPSAANAEVYAREVAEAAARRRLLQVHQAAAQSLANGVGTAREFAEDAQEAIAEAVGPLREGGGFAPMSALVDGALEQLDRARLVQGGITGVGTGFPEFDRMTTGLHEGELVVLAARPGIGKTSLAVNMGLHVALSGAGPVAVFSLEMPAMQLALRALAAEGRVSLRRLREGGLSDYDMAKISEAAAKVYSAPLFVDDAAALTLQELRARAKALKQAQKKLALVVVDYLQLLGRGGKWQSREAEVAENSRGLKQLAKELRVPVLALAQMNRKVEERSGGRPMLSDLRESGSIEADADLVMFIHPDEDESGEDSAARGDRKPMNLIIAKQRNGPTGDVALDLIAEQTRFEPRPWPR